MISEKVMSNVSALGDWVIIKKCKDLDGIKKVGSVYIPDSANINARESKIGIVQSVGKGIVDNKGRFNANTVEVGRYCYYTRFGKQVVYSGDEDFIIVKDRGVLAYIDFLDISSFSIKEIIPRYDYLFVEVIPIDNDVTQGGIIIPNPDPKKGEYRRYKVHAIGNGQPIKTKDRIDHINRIPVESSVGSVVWATEYCGVQISYLVDDDRKVFRLIPEHECIMLEV